MKRFSLLYILLLMLACFDLKGEDNSHVQLLIKFPTRDRYVGFFKALDAYYQKLSNKVSYHFVVSCDEDDDVMNSEMAIEKLKTYPHLSYYFGQNKSKIEAINADMGNHLNFDVLLLASDDMIPIVDGYDEIIVNAMKEHFPDTDGVLHFNDGKRGADLNTLSILGKAYYNRFGYLYYPGYKSLFCDDEFMAVSRQLNKVVYNPMVIIEHRHFTSKKAIYDDLYKRNQAYQKQDKALFRQRSQINFGLNIQEEK